jgi:hypothetical protein
MMENTSINPFMVSIPKATMLKKAKGSVCVNTQSLFVLTRARFAGAKTDNVKKNNIRFLSSCQAEALKGRCHLWADQATRFMV